MNFNLQGYLTNFFVLSFRKLEPQTPKTKNVKLIYKCDLVYYTRYGLNVSVTKLQYKPHLYNDFKNCIKSFLSNKTISQVILYNNKIVNFYLA